MLNFKYLVDRLPPDNTPIQGVTLRDGRRMWLTEREAKGYFLFKSTYGMTDDERKQFEERLIASGRLTQEDITRLRHMRELRMKAEKTFILNQFGAM